MAPVSSDITRTFPQRGPLQQFRLAETTAFRCFRCGATKKSKLIAIYTGDWSRRLCNGCYGRILSLYEIKAGTRPDEIRSQDLADALVSAVKREDQRRAERLYRASEARAEYLSTEAVRFIATAEHVAAQLEPDVQLEWSPAVIGLCKAVEFEVVTQILIPLRGKLIGTDLSADKQDSDLGRVARFCVDKPRKPPELGAFAFFLQTVIHSQRRRQSSAIVRAFLQLTGEWVGSNWILDPDSFHKSLLTLTTQFRNRAAHIDELDRDDYLGCRNLVIGEQGVLWQLLDSTAPHR